MKNRSSPSPLLDSPSLVRWTRYLLGMVVLSAVLLGGGYLGVRHVLWPRLDAIRPLLLSQLSEHLGERVEVTRLGADWVGVNPSVTIEGLQVRDTQGTVVLQAPELSAQLSWRSLFSGEPRFTRIVLTKAQIEIEREAHDLWRVAGIAFRPDEPLTTLRWMLTQSDIELRGARLRIQDRALPDGSPRTSPALVQVIEGLDLSLRNDGTHHEFALKLAESGPELQAIRVDSVFSHQRFKPVEDIAHWSGKASVSAQRLDLAVLARHVQLPAGLARGVLQGQADLTLAPPRQGHARTGEADLNLTLRDLELRTADGPVSLQTVSMAAGVGLGDALWTVRVKQLDLTDPASLTLKINSGGQGLTFDRADGRPRAGQVNVSRFELADASRWLGRLPMSDEWRDRLRQQAPKATMTEGKAKWSRGSDERLVWELDAGFERASLTAVPGPPNRLGQPGFSNLAGRIHLGDQGGRVQLSATDASLVFPGLLAEAGIGLDQLSADFRWQFGDGAAAWSIEQLRFSNADLAGDLSGSLQIPRSNVAAMADLTGRLQRVEAKRIPRYLPTVMDPSLRTWLAGALQGGQVRDARLRLVGRLYGFPFVKPGEGTFRVDVPVRDVRLAYADGWPAADAMTGDLTFAGNGMTVKLESAQIFGVRLSAINASIASFDRSLLRLDALGVGPAQDLVRFANDSPLNARLGGVTTTVQASGEARLNVRLELPLAQIEQTTVEGGVQFAGNSVNIDPAIPPLTQVNGRLEFSDRGFALRDMRGVFLGGPMALEADTQGPSPIVSGRTPAPSSPPIQVRAKGAVSATGLRQLVDNGILRRLSGNTHYEAQLTVQGGSTRLRVSSDLVGLGSALPAPFTKAPETALPLALELRPLASVGKRESAVAAGDEIVARLGESIRMVFERRFDPASKGLVPSRGILAIGSEPTLPESGFAVRVESDVLDVDQWSQVLGDNRMPDVSSKGADLVSVLPSVVTIRTKDLVIAGRHLQDAVVGATRAGGYWRANVRSRGIDGYFNWRDALPGQPIGTLTARFGRLVIPESRRSDVASMLADALPDRLPGLDVAAEELVLGEANLGAFQMIASNGGSVTEPVWQIDTLTLRNAGGKLSASGRWSGESSGALAVPNAASTIVRPEDRVTRLNFDLEVEDSARLLSTFGFVDVIRGGSGRISGELNWKGLPMSWETRTLGGQLALEMGRGQFLKADPGLAKLIGVLNLQSLPRRLNLDFRDIFAEGFAFDRISGRVAIKEGVARTADLRMQGISALVAIRGSADIPLETQNLTVEVVPQLNAGLAALGYAAAVNPAIGLGSLIAQFVLREPLQALFAYTVDVRGPWADPVVVRRSTTGPATSLK